MTTFTRIDLKADMGYYKYLINQTRLHVAYYSVLGTLFFILSMIIFIFIRKPFKQFTKVVEDDIVIIQGAGFWRYLWECISGKRLRWYQHYFEVCDDYGVACYRDDEYLFIPSRDYPLIMKGEAKIYYNGTWHTVNQEELSW